EFLDPAWLKILGAFALIIDFAATYAAVRIDYLDTVATTGALFHLFDAIQWKLSRQPFLDSELLHLALQLHGALLLLALHFFGELLLVVQLLLELTQLQFILFLLQLFDALPLREQLFVHFPLQVEVYGLLQLVLLALQAFDIGLGTVEVLDLLRLIVELLLQGFELVGLFGLQLGFQSVFKRLFLLA